jgi:hypothetical protein
MTRHIFTASLFQTYYIIGEGEMLARLFSTFLLLATLHHDKPTSRYSQFARRIILKRETEYIYNYIYFVKHKYFLQLPNMLFTSIIVAVFGLTALGRSHMKMSNPVPFGKSSLDTSPLADDGSDFPCKNRTGVYDPEGANNIMPLGSVQPLEFIGIAVHAGGSCQVSITYDLQPTNLSVFKVIHSIEGGCPAQNTTGNLDSEGGTATSPDPFTYSFMVPSSIPTGNATIAWTWFNKDGNREMYMVRIKPPLAPF